jgi:hypothetical protein
VVTFAQTQHRNAEQTKTHMLDEPGSYLPATEKMARSTSALRAGTRKRHALN